MCIRDRIKEERFHELMSLQAQISEDMHHNMEDMILEFIKEHFGIAFIIFV